MLIALAMQNDITRSAMVAPGFALIRLIRKAALAKPYSGVARSAAIMATRGEISGAGSAAGAGPSKRPAATGIVENMKSLVP